MTMLPGRLAPSKLIGPAEATRRRRPRPWALALIAALLLGTLLLGGRPWEPLMRPEQLTQTALVGPRTPGCIRLMAALDNSGSMSGFAEPRDNALRQLLGWVPKNLRAEDQVGVIVFAGTAATALAPTSAAHPENLGPVSISMQGTSLAPVLAAMRALPHSKCRTALLIIGDGQFFDLPRGPAKAQQQLTEAGVDRLALLVPGHAFVGLRWRLLYPEAAPVRFDGNDGNDTAVTIAQQVANLTDQELVEQ